VFQRQGHCDRAGACRLGLYLLLSVPTCAHTCNEATAASHIAWAETYFVPLAAADQAVKDAALAGKGAADDPPDWGEKLAVAM
jgi:hypothetical protein